MKETITSMEVYQEGKRFWSDQVKHLDKTASYIFPSMGTHRGREKVFALFMDQDLAANLYKMSNQNDLLLYVILLSAMDIMVFRYSGSRDVTIGGPVYIRSDHEHIFNDWILFRTKIPDGATVQQLLDINRKCVMQAHQNQHYPLNNVFSSPGHEEFRTFSPGIMLSLSSIHGHEPAGRLTWMDEGQLNLSMKYTGNTFELSLRYDSNVFESDQIESLAQGFLIICDKLVAGREKKIEDIEYLTAADKNKQLLSWNDTECHFEQELTVHATFEATVKKYPDAIALVSQKESISYRRLDARANSLAVKLRESMPEATSCRLVGIYIESSIELIVSVMATLKAGAAFLPITRQHPDLHIRYILQDGRIKTLLTDENVAERFGFTGQMILIHESESVTHAACCSRPPVQGNDPAYVIYTSGSSGSPKGVLIEHQAVINSALWRIRAYEMCSESKLLNLTSSAFDGFYSVLFSVLLSGGRAILSDRVDMLDLLQINHLIDEAGITNIALIPALYDILLDSASSDQYSSLRAVLLAAESTSADLIDRSHKLAPHVMLANEYGPTENSVVSLAYFHMDSSNPSIIGRPISNTQAYILDPNLSLLPIGATGEICVSGAGLARGYLNRPDLTREKFVPHPFNANERLYRTGDLGRHLGNGCIEFRGRIDRQIKIRGYRVEAEEVERCIEMLPGIRRAVVVPYQKCLAAYYSPLDRSINEPAIRSHIRDLLPDYMIPSLLIPIIDFPVTATGKVDLGALPPPDSEKLSEQGPRAPENEIEQLLIKIWESVLGRKGIGTDDDFYDLGGDSIKALQIIAAIRQEGYECSIESLFAKPSIDAFSLQVEKGGRKIPQVSIEGSVSLTPIQKWLLEQQFEKIQHFNQSVMLFREEGFDVEILSIVFAELVKHHDALRMTFLQAPSGIQQLNQEIDHQAFTLIEYDFRDVSSAGAEKHIAQEADTIQMSINLSAGPLVKAGLFKTASGDHLLIAVHHLVVDGYSWRILLEDFETSYSQVLQGTSVALPLKTTSFQEWAASLERYALNEISDTQVAYWNRAIASMQQKCPDLFAAGTAYHNLATVKCSLKTGTAKQLIETASNSFDTGVETLLLAALALAYRRWCRQDCVPLCIEGHGRQDLFKDVFVGRTVGWFTTQFPLMLEIPTEDSCLAVTLTSAALEEVPGKGLGFGILKYLTDSSAHQKIRQFQHPRILFNYMGQFELGGTQDNSIFRVSDLHVGADIHPDWKVPFDLSVNVSVNSQEADISLQYNHNIITEEEITQFSFDYSNFLENIVAEGLRQKKKGIVKHRHYQTVDREYHPLSSNHGQKIFMFPPKMSLGLSYFWLGEYVGEADLVAFDFIERSSRLTDYIEYITDLQKSGPYILGGYSSAALVLEVAREMQERNLWVSDIILLDAKPSDLLGEYASSEPQTAKSIDFYIKSMKPVQGDSYNAFMRKTKDKIRAYARFINSARDISILDVNIHFIKSLDSLDEDIQQCQTLSSRQIRIYEGAGEHSFMLSGSAAHVNASIISTIVAAVKG